MKDRVPTLLVNKNSITFPGLSRTTFNKNQGLEYVEIKEKNKTAPSHAIEHGKLSVRTS